MPVQEPSERLNTALAALLSLALAGTLLELGCASGSHGMAGGKR